VVDPTSGQEVLLTRYRVLAATRRHFSSLFFGTVAFAWIFSLVLWTALTSTGSVLPAVAEGTAGSALLAGAFIEHRLLLRERSAFEAMCGCWRAISNEEESAASKRTLPGAMSIVVIVQCLVGVVVCVVGLFV
jgi:hypothetical protein